MAWLIPFLARHDALFDCTTPEGGVVCYPRYNGPDGVLGKLPPSVERFTERMAETAGILLLPASVFRSELLELPSDRFRIGFGSLSFAAGLAAFERALA